MFLHKAIYRFLLVGGLAALLWVGGSVVYAGIYQRYAFSQFEKQYVSDSVGDTDKSSKLQMGDIIGKLEIPRVGLSVMVLEGVDENALNLGAGHVPGTFLAGSGGNFAVAGHRDTFFRKLRTIRAGDSISVSTEKGTFGYSVTTTEVVEPADVHVLRSRGYSELTLITCYPFSFIGGAPHRFVVHARQLVPLEKTAK